MAQSATRLLLERADARIEVVNRGRADQGARSILDLAGCLEERPADRSNLFYAPDEGVTTTVVQEGGEPTRITAPLTIVVRPPRHADEDGADGNGAPDEAETIEALDATATFGRPPCLETVETAASPRVTLEQGRTTATGSRFFLDRDSDVGELDGPVSLERAAEGDGDPVGAEAERLRFDVGAGRSTLTGAVRVRSGERVSEADELELNEEEGVAILRGDPAVSRLGEDEVRGRRLAYDLETNDVVVEDGVSGRFVLPDEVAD